MENKPKEYRKERFEFILTVNDNIICQRYFKINNFNEQSLSSLELKDTINHIVNMIDSDLKSKSRVYTWYMYDENYVDDEFSKPLSNAWDCTFKFSFLDNEREVLSQIWDGSGYPKFIRESVDITNKKTRFEDIDPSRLNFDNSLLKAMVGDKQDLVPEIINMIYETCSVPYSESSDYTITDSYSDKKYILSNKLSFNRMANDIKKSLQNKTRKYMSSLY